MLITFAIIGAGCCFSVANTHMGSPGHPHTEVLGEDWSNDGFPLSDMLITFAVIIGAGCCISVANTHVGGLGSSHNTEVFAEGWSSEEQNIDHLVGEGRKIPFKDSICFRRMYHLSVHRFQVARLIFWITLIAT